jgi:hypothetical protein
MNTIYDDPNTAMQVAYGIAQQTGKRVWRHAVENKWGVARWIVSFEKDAQIALQGLSA